MTQSRFLRLQRIVVDGLFGTYNHDINLNLNDRVTLLHGPNGVGKTVILEMIRALLEKRFEYFWSIPFSQFSLSFHDGSTIELQANNETDGDDRRHLLTLVRNGTRESAAISHALSASSIAARVECLRPHGGIAHTWMDIRDGEILSASEVISRYADVLSSHDDRDDEDLDWFSNFLENANAHFIETQRLVRMDSEPSTGYGYSRRSRRAPAPMISTVVEYSRDFSKRLANTMAQYGRKSQALDQSFPQRLMDPGHELEVQDLQNRMSNLDEITSAYTSMGILDKTPTYPFPVSSLGDIDSTQARVMTLYVQDTEKKLQALEDPEPVNDNGTLYGIN